MSKKQKLFHCTVTFRDLGEATIRDLTQEQAWAIQDVMRLIEQKPPRYSESGVLLYSVRVEADRRRATTESSGFLTRLMRRFNAWAMGGCVIVFLLAGLGFAQERKPRAVVKVNFVIQGDAGHVEKLNGALRSELRRRRDVVVTAGRPDYAVDVVVAPVIVDNEVVAFVAAVLITRKSGGDFLAVAVEADLQTLAKQVAARLNDDSIFQPRRGR